MILAKKTGLDLTGVGLSLGCAVHCLGLPVAAAFAPSLSTFAEAEWVHWAVLLLATPIAGLAMLNPRAPNLARILAVAGLSAMLMGALEFPSHELEAWVSALGGALLASGHIVNMVTAHRLHGHRAGGCASQENGRR